MWRADIFKWVCPHYQRIVKKISLTTLNEGWIVLVISLRLQPKWSVLEWERCENSPRRSEWWSCQSSWSRSTEERFSPDIPSFNLLYNLGAKYCGFAHPRASAKRHWVPVSASPHLLPINLSAHKFNFCVPLATDSTPIEAGHTLHHPRYDLAQVTPEQMASHPMLLWKQEV